MNLDIASSDLDAADETISLAWSLSSGVAGSYQIEIRDGNSQKYSSSASSSPKDISFSDMLNGHVYNVFITAKSEKYEGDQQVDGVTFNGNFKTVVKGKFRVTFVALRAY